MTRMFNFPEPDGGAEPARDERLGALLRDAVGEPTMTDRDWSALADRVTVAVRGRHAIAWWSYVARWQRGALPLALAAGLIGALALWSEVLNAPEVGTTYATDAVAAVVSGASSADAAGSYAGFITNTVDVSAGVPE